MIDQRLEQIRKAVPATRDQAVLEAGIILTHWVCKIIAVLNQAIADLDERIRPLARAHPDYSIFDSLPGAGEVMVPRLIAAFGTKHDRFANASQVQNFSGIAPVKEASGHSEWIHMRWACSKFLRQTFHEWAGHSIPQSEWARAYYNQQVAKGNGHHAAVRSLAAKWIRIVYRCWANHTPYDERVYLDACGGTVRLWCRRWPRPPPENIHRIAHFSLDGLTQKTIGDFSALTDAPIGASVGEELWLVAQTRKVDPSQGSSTTSNTLLYMPHTAMATSPTTPWRS